MASILLLLSSWKTLLINHNSFPEKPRCTSQFSTLDSHNQSITYKKERETLCYFDSINKLRTDNIPPTENRNSGVPQERMPFEMRKDKKINLLFLF